ncbi:MAG: PIN domain-containing protein [Bryobacteraceae bacterium]
MKRVLVDINVLLDVLIDRQPYSAAGSAVWASIESGRVKGFLAAHAITTVHYFLRKEHGAAKTRRSVQSILRVFQIAPIDRAVLEEAMSLPGGDFEDAVTAAAAHRAGCELIVTRDPKGFRGSPVQAINPEAAVLVLKL